MHGESGDSAPYPRRSLDAAAGREHHRVGAGRLMLRQGENITVSAPVA
jgi:hypothetical protein